MPSKPRPVNKIIEIPIKSGVRPVLMVLSSLVRGNGYILSAFSDEREGTDRRKSFSMVSAMRSRWLYKYAIQVVTDRHEIKTQIERECFGLNVPVVIVDRSCW